MIVSASRRTDIPAFYSEWFLRRLRAGFVLVRNPFDARRIRRVPLDPKSSECIVFWTRDASRFGACLDELDARGFLYYFLHTLTPYGTGLEPGLPPLERRIEAFLDLAARLGPRRVVWRYDPVLMAEGIDTSFHRESFSRIATSLRGATDSCVVSLLDMYRHLGPRKVAGLFREPDVAEAASLLSSFAHEAEEAGIRLQSCCEPEFPGIPGLVRAACIDAGRIALIARDEGRLAKPGGFGGAAAAGDTSAAATAADTAVADTAASASADATTAAASAASAAAVTKTLFTPALFARLSPSDHSRPEYPEASDDDAALAAAAGLAAGRDRSQRPGCLCAPSVDIGCYDSCAHGCRYCYAVRSPARLSRNRAVYDVDSPELCAWQDPP